MKLAAGFCSADSGRVWVMGHDLAEMSGEGTARFPPPSRIRVSGRRALRFDERCGKRSVPPARRKRRRTKKSKRACAKRCDSWSWKPRLKNFPRSFPEACAAAFRSRARWSISRRSFFTTRRPPGLDPVTSQTIITLILRGRDLQGVTSLLATHRVQDAFGLAHFRFDRGERTAWCRRRRKRQCSRRNRRTNGQLAPTNVLVLREGEVYFEGTTDDVLHSSDDYLKKFLASAE